MANDTNIKQSFDFQDWLERLTSDYRKLSNEERNETLGTLVGASSGNQLHYLQTAMDTLVYRDFLSHLPREIVECLLSFLDPISLFNCCQVCSSWNNIICNTTSVWYQACVSLELQLRMDRHEYSAKMWKELYLSMSSLFSKMHNYNAFKQTNYLGHTVRVTAAYYWHNKLATGSDDHSIRIWDTEQDICESVIPTECSISCIKFGRNLLMAASYAGFLKSYCWKSTNHLRDYIQHTAAVFTMDYNYEYDLMVSGGADDTIRTWSIGKGVMWSALRGHDHWVITVLLVTTGIDDQLNLLSMDRHEIRIWPIMVNTGPPFDIKCTQRIPTSITNFNFFTPGLHCISNKLYFIKQDPGSPSTTLLCCWDLETQSMKYQHELFIKVKLLLGVGKKYFSILTPVHDGKNPNFLVFSLKTRKPVVKWFVPPSRPSSPGNSQMTLAETDWLNGLHQENHNGTVYVAGLEDCSFYVLKWRTSFSSASFHTAHSFVE